MDFAWVRSTSSPLWGDQNLSRIIQLPPNRRLFYAHLLDIIDTTFNTDYMSRWAAHYGSLAEEDYSSLLSYIGQRRNFVLSTIPAKVPFAVTTNGGADFSVGEISTTIEGNAWFDVRYIFIMGDTEPLDPTWLDTTRWRARVDLDFGPNQLVFGAADLHWDFLGSSAITVTSTVGGPAPVIDTVTPSSALPGDMVVLEGSDFRPGIEVFFEDVKSSLVEIDGPASLRAAVPALLPGIVNLTVRNADGRRSKPVEFTVRGASTFIRGDANFDFFVDLSDAVRILFHLYAGTSLPCEDAADADDNEVLDLTAVIWVLDYLFRSGPAPAPPYPLPGMDPGAAGPLDCVPP